MSDLAVRVVGLGKQYHIYQARERPDTLRALVSEVALRPVRAAGTLLRRNGAPPPEMETFWALRDISFEVSRGEAVAVIGRNGAGKSTLLKVLSRITEPSEGYADIHGRVSSLLEVGTGFHPDLSGRDNVYLNGAILGLRRAEIRRKFDEIVGFAEVERFIDTPVKRYSSGMYLRLAFAVAAHLEPDILIVDEVLAVGDASFQKKCMGKMQDVTGEGRTVLFVSHNMAAVTRLCPRAVLLSGGRLSMEGPSAAVVAEYLRSERGTVASREWSPGEAPGTEELTLRSVAIEDEEGVPSSHVGVGQQLTLRVGYVVQSAGMRFRCSVQFWTQGVCAFHSVEPVEVPRDECGLYHSTLTVPANLLAEGEYTVHVALLSSRGRKTSFAVATDAVAFQVYDPLNGQTAGGDYTERLIGVMRPLLSWKLELAARPMAGATSDSSVREDF